MENSSSSKDILVAEDNAINQFLVTRMLERSGYSFRVAGNGAEVLQAFQEREPALILMDVQMPVMDGLEATQEIRKIEQSSGGRVPIIAVTARALTDDEQKCREAGMDDYMSKPIKVQLLIEKLSKWLSPNRTAEAA